MKTLKFTKVELVYLDNAVATILSNVLRHRDAHAERELKIYKRIMKKIDKALITKEDI